MNVQLGKGNNNTGIPEQLVNAKPDIAFHNQRIDFFGKLNPKIGFKH